MTKHQNLEIAGKLQALVSTARRQKPRHAIETLKPYLFGSLLGSKSAAIAHMEERIAMLHRQADRAAN